MGKKTLGAFIALLRKEKALTQKQLAELLNVSDKTVSHWECDETSPDISLLPLLAKNLGVTVDELLQGEKKPTQAETQYNYNALKSESIIDKAEQYATKTVNKIKENANSDVTERYKLFRILSLIGTVISLVVFANVSFSAASGASFGTYVNFMFMPGIIALFGSLWTIAISLGFTIGARYYFSKELRPTENSDEKEKEYLYKANIFSYNNIFLVLSILPMPVIGIDIFPLWANVIAVFVFIASTRLLLTVILSKNGIIRTRKKKLLQLRFLSIFFLSAAIVSGSLLAFREAYYPSLEAIYFDSSAEFIAYMETPKSKPDNAYIIEGVSATTHPPTMPAPGNSITVDSPVGVGQISADFAEENVGETVLGYCGGELITFKWLNNEVSDCTYLENESRFRVITYEAEIKQKDMIAAVEDNVPIAIAIFCISDVTICFLLYRKKAIELQEA